MNVQASEMKDEGSEVLCRLLTAQGDAFEAFDLADALLNAGARLVADAGKECRLCGSVLAVGNRRTDAAPARCLAVGLGVVPLSPSTALGVMSGPISSRMSKLRLSLASPPVRWKASGNPSKSVLQVDFGGKPAARAPEGLVFLPPFAPAVETWARTTVESTIWTRCAVPLISAKMASIASKTPLWLSRQNRFHTLFQGPNSTGKARQVML
jgi:hypothetical protein